MMPESLRHKLLRGLLVPLSLLWLAASVVAYFLAIRFATVAHDRALFDSTRSLAEQVRLVNGKATVHLPPIAQEMLLYDEYDKIYYRVSDQDGQEIAGNPEVPLPTGRGKVSVPIFHDGSIRGKDVRIASLYLALDGNRTILIQTAETLNKRKILAEEILTGVMVPQLILILLAALIVWRGVGRGLMPLERLCDEIATKSHRNLSPVEKLEAPQEISPLVHAINELISRLASALEIQQRFLTNATHQLRTPLACLRTQTELAIRQEDPEKREHALQQLNISSMQATRLVNQMLALAKVEIGADRKMSFDRVDLCALAKEATADWVPRALQRQIDLGFESTREPLLIQGDAVYLRMLLDNLIDNAIRYSPGGGHATVKVENNQNPVLTVEDEGPGIPCEERGKVFQRFYRILDSGGEGSGLGLAIVQEVATLHGAQVSINEPLATKGTSISVVFKL